jgi:hypothetical protein
VWKRAYWLDLFTGTTWKEFVEAGASVSGFPESRWKTVQQVHLGDYLLCTYSSVNSGRSRPRHQELYDEGEQCGAETGEVYAAWRRAWLGSLALEGKPTSP